MNLHNSRLWERKYGGMIDDAEHRKDRHDQVQARVKAKFADYVQIHAIEGKVITRADEKTILEEGLTRFDLDFREAQGILLSVASERELVLVSHVEHHIDTYLEQVAKRGKVARKDFNKASMLYRSLTNESIPLSEVRTRIKQLVEHRGWTGKRRGLLFGSKRWFKKI